MKNLRHRDTKTTKIATVVFVLFVSLWLVSARADDTPEQLKAKLSTETDPVRKARLAVHLAEIEFEQGRKDFSEGALDQMMAHIELAYSSLIETKRDPRRKPAGFKDMEIKLRTLNRRLDDLRSSLPLDERPPLEKMILRIRDIEDDLLNGLMHTRKDQKKDL
jgi:hypothetical protein